ncbi:hypothetical protein, partial [Paenibacillus macerans]|uniref:hypothetical protein n=1 Tax=Paenibacillus macerans TaxID=44252 RepID=UPI003D323AA7
IFRIYFSPDPFGILGWGSRAPDVNATLMLIGEYYAPIIAAGGPISSFSRFGLKIRSQNTLISKKATYVSRIRGKKGPYS